MASKYLLLLDPAPQRTFYVSPSFTGNPSPTFTTIQAAINAADGVNPTLILIYPGTYAEAITLKANVFLRGIQRESVLIEPPTGTTAISYTAVSVVPCGIESLTIVGDDATVKGIVLTGTAWSVRVADVIFAITGGTGLEALFNDTGCKLTVTNCIFNIFGGKGIYIHNISASTVQDVLIKDSVFSTTSANVNHIEWDLVAPSDRFVIQGCRFWASQTSTYHLKATSDAYGGSFVGCHFACNLNGYVMLCTESAGNAPTYFFTDCTLYQGRLLHVNAPAQPDNITVKWRNGPMHRVSRIANITEGMSVVEVSGSTIEMSGVTSVVLFDNTTPNPVTAAIRFYNCTIISGTHNPLLSTTVSVFVNVVWRDGNDFAPGQAGTSVFFGNFTTTKALASGNIAQAAGSFGVVTGLTIP